MKIEVGKKYELNNGEVHECTHMRGSDLISVDDFGYGPFVINDILYHQDGRFADADADHEYSVKREVLTVQVGKYYRTRDGRKVGPIGYNPNITNYGKFFSGETFWDEFGRLYQATKETDHALIAEWTEPETGTLAELDVKPGDVVELIGGSKTQYTIDRIHKEKVFGDKTSVNLSNDGCGNGWKLISRASDAPKTWGDEDGWSEWTSDADWDTSKVDVQMECIDGIYRTRTRPRKPVRETVTLYAGHVDPDCDPMPIGTIDLENGKPDLDSIKMEALG